MGGVSEFLGFLLVSVDLYRLQRHEFGPLWIERAAVAIQAASIRLWRKITRAKPTTHYGEATLGGISATGTGKASMRVGTASKSLDERVNALETNFRELDREVEEQRLELSTAIHDVEANLDEAFSDLREKQEQRDLEERALRRRSLKFQWAGIPLFLFGVIFSVLGNIVSC